MTMKRWDGGAFIDLTVAKRWDGGSWIDLTIARRWDGGSWVDIPLPGGGGGGLSATISSASANGFEFRAEPAPSFVTVFIDTPASITVTPTGGTGPYTYLWERISGAAAVGVSNPTGSVVTFSANVPKNQTREAVYRCTVFDSLLASFAVTCAIELVYNTDI